MGAILSFPTRRRKAFRIAPGRKLGEFDWANLNLLGMHPRYNRHPAYDEGVQPFDERNPAHISAWNAMWAFGQME